MGLEFSKRNLDRGGNMSNKINAVNRGKLAVRSFGLLMD